MYWWKFFRCVVLISLPMMVSGASIPDPRKPLRYPFGLTPDTTSQYLQEILTSKGLKRVSEKEAGVMHFATWRMTGQISYENFKPTLAMLSRDNQKLSSVMLVEDSLPDCGAAQPVYRSALAFVRDNYMIDKHNTLTREPAEDTLDCGPHFKGDDYELQLTSKDYVLSVIPILKDGHYQVSVTYRWAGLLTSIQGKDEMDQKERHAVPENL